MNWSHYWATRPTQPKIAMKKPSQYLAWLQDKNLSPHTITSYLNALNGLPAKFTTQNLKEYFQTNLKKYQATTLKVRKYALNSYVKFKKLKVEWEKIARLIPSVQRKFFDTINETELKKLKETKVERSPAIHERNNLILDFLLYSGVRINELIHIKHLDPHSQDYLFLNQRGHPLKAEYLRWLLKARTKQAQIKKKITPHTFRRSFATLLYQKGAQLMTIQRLLGHASVQTTEGYIHNDFAYLYGDYSRLWLNSSQGVNHA